MAASSIVAVAFECEVGAWFGFIFKIEVSFMSDLVVSVCKGALDSVLITFYRKGQYPFSMRYLHF